MSGKSLVEEALAADGPTETWDAVCGIHLALELVVVSEFFVCHWISGAYETREDMCLP